MSGDRFEAVFSEGEGGYGGLGSGYYYIADSYTGDPVHDKEGLMIVFDVEDGNRATAKRLAEKYIDENYDELVCRADEEYEKS